MSVKHKLYAFQSCLWSWSPHMWLFWARKQPVNRWSTEIICRKIIYLFIFIQICTFDTFLGGKQWILITSLGWGRSVSVTEGIFSLLMKLFFLRFILYIFINAIYTSLLHNVSIAFTVFNKCHFNVYFSFFFINFV